MGKGIAGHRNQRLHEVIASWQAAANSWAQSLSKNLENCVKLAGIFNPLWKTLVLTAAGLTRTKLDFFLVIVSANSSMAKAPPQTSVSTFPGGMQATSSPRQRMVMRGQLQVSMEHIVLSSNAIMMQAPSWRGVWLFQGACVVRVKLLPINCFGDGIEVTEWVWGFSSLCHLSNQHWFHGAGKWVVNRCSGKLDHLQSVYKYFPLAPCQFCHPPHLEKTCMYVPSRCPRGPFWWDWCWRHGGVWQGLVSSSLPHPQGECHFHSLDGEVEAATSTVGCKAHPWFEDILK